MIATIDDPELRLEMLFNLTEAQVRALPANLRREHDEGREAQAHRIAEQERARLRQAERQQLADRAHALGGMPPGYRGYGARNRGDGEDPNEHIDKVIENVERHVFDRQELANYKAQAKLIERQIETEDTLIETILRLIINQSDDRLIKNDKSANASKNENSQVTKEALENAQCSELMCLITTLDMLRQSK